MKVLRRAIDTVAGAFVLAALAATRVAAESAAATVYTVTTKRIAASTAILTGLIAAAISWLALVRSVRRIGNDGRRGAMVAMVLGPISLIIGGAVLATAEGGVGTGNGVAGGVVAIVVAVIGMVLA